MPRSAIRWPAVGSAIAAKAAPFSFATRASGVGADVPRGTSHRQALLVWPNPGHSGGLDSIAGDRGSMRLATLALPDDRKQ
jgi:hypothetical protein